MKKNLLLGILLSFVLMGTANAGGPPSASAFLMCTSNGIIEHEYYVDISVDALKDYFIPRYGNSLGYNSHLIDSIYIDGDGIWYKPDEGDSSRLSRGGPIDRREFRGESLDEGLHNCVESMGDDDKEKVLSVIEKWGFNNADSKYRLVVLPISEEIGEELVGLKTELKDVLDVEYFDNWMVVRSKYSFPKIYINILLITIVLSVVALIGWYVNGGATRIRTGE